MRAEYGKLMASEVEPCDEEAEGNPSSRPPDAELQQTEGQQQAHRLLGAGFAFILLTVILFGQQDQPPPSTSVDPAVPQQSIDSSEMIEEPGFSLHKRAQVRCASSGVNEVLAASTLHASPAENPGTCWTLNRMAERATAAGLCFFVVPTTGSGDDSAACLPSMRFCSRPLHLTADAGYVVYSACADADPMAAKVSSAGSAPPPSTATTAHSSTDEPPKPKASLAAAQIASPVRAPVPARAAVRPPPPPPLPPVKSPSPAVPSAFVRVTAGGRGFERNGQPFRFLGTTLWYGAQLAMTGAGGDRARLARELDVLQALGVKQVRVLASSEGTAETPYHAVPAMQPSPGVYARDALEGLDYLLRELGRRNMVAVLILNNGLPWSGGMAQYVAWATHTRPPFSMRQPDWDAYTEYVNMFFKLDDAMKLFEDYVRSLLGRRNSFTGVAYASDPTIMAWEIANEPRGGKAVPPEYGPWVRGVATLIKTLDRNHLVTVGSEGTGGRDPFRLDFDADEIDYTVAHVWPERFNWYKAAADPDGPQGVSGAISRTASYVSAHCQWAESLEKPLVIDGFALSRDLAALDPTGPTGSRDKYFGAVLNSAVEHMHKDSCALGGVSVWAWAGEGRPAARAPGEESSLGWREGDPLLGDPPSDPQGLFSIYTTDTDTFKVIEKAASKINLMSAVRMDKASHAAEG